jgi:dipeptidyl aminopeptidase/acylaminoacyl peptidase
VKNVMHDEFGGKDVDDVITLLNFIPNITGAVSKRVGMYGASRGGMQTHLALKKMTSIKAIATFSGVSDLLKDLETRPAMENVYIKRIPDYNTNKVSALAKRSVLTWVDQLSPNIPILLLHGTKDTKVSVNNSIDLAAALSKNDIPHKLVLYSDDDHYLTTNKDKANAELVNWFRKYL